MELYTNARFISCEKENRIYTAMAVKGGHIVWLGDESDIAEAFYGVPEELRQECRQRLTPELTEILREWESALYNEKICGRI